MKKMLLLTGALLVASAAHADWIPRIVERHFTTTITLNGGTNQINSAYEGELYTAAYAIVDTGKRLQTTINAAMAQTFAEKGGSLNSGALTGPYRVRLTPNGGETNFWMTGANYVATGTASGKYSGISYTCYLTIKLNDIQAVARFAGGALVTGSGSTTYARDVSASCSTAISWMPIFGDMAERFAQRMAVSIANGAIDSYAKGLFDDVVNRYAGAPSSALDRVANTITAVTQANGVTVDVPSIMRLVTDNQGSIDMTLGTFAPNFTKFGVGAPDSNFLVGQVLDFNFSHPWIGNFRMGLVDNTQVRWIYQCPGGSRSCQIP
ncbi:hypothetical protein ACQ86G_05725 [Roseateles chitinivorans]|uniref:hypothetical protein n=1 Tax=Roseateles chitinivorans TaxID=2917965 RepID=UPI003D6735C5